MTMSYSPTPLPHSRLIVIALIPSLLLSLVFLLLPSSASAQGSSSLPKINVSTGQIKSLVSRQLKPHPRLLIPEGGFADLRQRVKENAKLAPIAATVVRDADAVLDEVPVARVLQGRRLLDKSRLAIRRILLLSMAYQLTEKSGYLDRAIREMLAVAEFPDWNPSHYLDVAEMTFAMAIGYDWLYDSIPEDSRSKIRDAILEKGVRVPLHGENDKWTKASNNWGQVCHGGMVAGALATMEDDPRSAAATLARAFEFIPISMAAYAPNGSYPEGPSYWTYGTSYNVLLIAMLQSAFGDSFGIDQMPGFDKTGAFPALTSGPSGLAFNYADGGSGRASEPATYWLAQHFGKPGYLFGEAAPLERILSSTQKGTNAGNRFFPLTLLWMQNLDAESIEKSALSDLPLHWTSDGSVPVSIHRTSWSDPNAVFLGVKGGSPSGPHAHMDAGSFVLDADGVRWAVDIGPENYNKIESLGMSLWSMAQDSDRWKIFRLNNLSHNTLVIDGQYQKVAGSGDMIRFSNAADFPHSVIDLSSIYAKQVSQAVRGFALLPSGEVLIHDVLSGLKRDSSVRWGMVTRATAEGLGSTEAKLRQGDASLTLRIVQPANAVWEWIDTAKPQNEWDAENPGTGMLALTAPSPSNGAMDILIVLTPGSREMSPVANIPQSSPLDWSAPRAAPTTRRRR